MSFNAEQVRDEIYRCIQDDPTIQDASHIAVEIIKHGVFGKREIELRGRVESNRDKLKVDEIVKSHSHGFNVIDSLRVQERHGGIRV